MRVGVVGAGPSGLATVKELLDEGHEPICFERASGLGGVFRFDEESGVVWESCRLTSSGLLTAFSDFPVDRDHRGHMTAREYVEYLTAYAEEFGADERIRFRTRVESIARASDGSWSITSVGPEGEKSERFDAVALCSGLHQHPQRVHFEGEQTFPGEILHGADYRRPSQVAGKRVLVVGAGESGADIAAEVAAHADETVLSLRRGVAVLPRMVEGYPNDYRTCRINNSPAHWIFQTRNPKDEHKRRVYKVVFFPFVLLDKGLEIAAARVGRLLTSWRARRLTDEQRAEAAVRRHMIRLIRELLASSGGTLQEQFGTKSADFVRAIANGRCRKEAGIARFEGARVVFEDGATFAPDLVILCTGFETKLPYLHGALAEEPRYLHTFVPTVGHTLGFIGFVRPAFGAIPPLAELQARWFALLLSGKTALPSEAEMTGSIERQAEFRRDYFRAVRGRLDHLVDYTSLCDELAAEVGCKPTRAALRRESPAFRVRFFASPFLAAQYRLVGPHAKPEIPREVITQSPIALPRHSIALFYLRWVLSRALYRMLGRDYAPKLVLR